MNKNILITIKKELRGIIRDKKSLMMILLTPLMIPGFIFLFSFIYDSMFQEAPTTSYEIGVNYELTEEEQSIAEELNLETIYYETEEELNDAYEKQEIPAYIIKENNNYIIYSNQNETASFESSAIASSYLEQYNTYLGMEYLNSINVNLEDVYANITVDFKDLKGSNEFVNMLISLGIIFAMMSISLTAIYGVTDTTAGEKERGTLETFLTFPIKSKELITGKYLAITLSCIVTSIISTVLVVASISISSSIFSIYKDAVTNINLISILTTLIIMISYSFFISGLCIAIASYSKTYKEAQSALTPISFLNMVPMIFDILEVKISTIIAFVPVVNHTMLVNNILTIGFVSNTMIHIIIMIISTLVYSFVIIKIITKMYKNEKILFSI